MKNKLISVIVPVYNVAAYLDSCINSIVNQTYKNLEIILINDGSTDKSGEMCDKWAAKDSRIRVIHKKNGGLSDARNAGLKSSGGEYISFIDSDDRIEQDFYLTLARALDDGYDIAECATRLCNENDETILIRGTDKNMDLTSADALKLLLQEHTIFQTVWNKLYKKDVVINTPFEFGKYHEDDFWTWQIFLNSKKIFVTDKPMYNYLQRKNSIMGNPYTLKRLDGLEAAYKCYTELNNYSEYSQLAKKKLISSCLYQLQCTLKYLKGDEKAAAKKEILSYVKKSKISFKDSSLGFWYKIFIVSPILTAKIRNIANIGF